MWTPGLSLVSKDSHESLKRTDWKDPMGWSRRMISVLISCGGIAGGWCTCPTAQTLHKLFTAPKSLRTRRGLMAREPAALPPSPHRRGGSRHAASPPCTSCHWSQRGSMKCAATVLCYAYPHPCAFKIWTAELPQKRLSQHTLKFPTGSP